MRGERPTRLVGLRDILALVLLVVLAIASPSTAAEGEAIKIGLVLPQSGPLSIVGGKIKQGFEAARTMLGPIPIGNQLRPVEFVVEQASGESWDPGLAAAACLKLKQAGVVAISGLGGGEGEGCNSVAGRIQIPIIGMNLTTAGVVTDKCSKWFVALSYSPQMSGRAFNVIAKEKFRDVLDKPWWVVSDAPDWGRDLALALRDSAGLKYQSIDIAPPGTTDWAPFLTKMRSSGSPVGMVITSWGDQYLAFIKQASDFGVDQKMRLVAPVGVPEWMLYQPGVADALARWTIPMQWGAVWTHESKWPMLKQFNETHFKLFGEPPSGQGLYGAGAYFMLWNAIKGARTTDAQPVLNKLLTEEVKSPIWEKPLKVDLPGRQVAMPIFVTQVVKLGQKTYGVQYAHKVTSVMTYAETRVTPEKLGCSAGGPY
jgi:ABC-type branched-subunit amino acid transport system substrate-binding protein